MTLNEYIAMLQEYQERYGDFKMDYSSQFGEDLTLKDIRADYFGAYFRLEFDVPQDCIDYYGV